MYKLHTKENAVYCRYIAYREITACNIDPLRGRFKGDLMSYCLSLDQETQIIVKSSKIISQNHNNSKLNSA